VRAPTTRSPPPRGARLDWRRPRALLPHRQHRTGRSADWAGQGCLPHLLGGGRMPWVGLRVWPRRRCLGWPQWGRTPGSQATPDPQLQRLL